MGKKVISAIKKTAHNEKKKPYSEVSEGIPREQALSLLGSLGTVKSDTKRMHKRILFSEDVRELLGIEEVHPVKFDGVTWCLAGETPSVYAWARVESLEVKVEESLLSMKVRTYMSGSGIPDSSGHCPHLNDRPNQALYDERFVKNCLAKISEL